MLQTLSLEEERSFPARAVRQVTVLINAAIEQGGSDGLCRIRNVSAGGLTIETSVTLVVGAGASVVLRTGDILVCVVRWVEDQRAGLSCAVDPTEMINRKVANEGGPALPRFARQARVGLVVAGIPYHCALDSISVGDVLATGVPIALRLGQMISVEIAGLGVRPATVQISQDGDLFARFAPALGFAALDRWLARSTGGSISQSA